MPPVGLCQVMVGSMNEWMNEWMNKMNKSSSNANDLDISGGVMWLCSVYIFQEASCGYVLCTYFRRHHVAMFCVHISGGIMWPCSVYIFQEASCGYVLALMAIYWVAELLPLPVTGFIPIVLLPVMGVMKASAVASKYIAVS